MTYPDNNHNNHNKTTTITTKKKKKKKKKKKNRNEIKRRRKKSWKHVNLLPSAPVDPQNLVNSDGITWSKKSLIHPVIKI